jgi:hypothetical protein
LLKNKKEMTVITTAQSLEDIKAQYPNEWILIGDLELKEPMLQTNISRNFKSGVVLLHGADRFEIARHAKEARVGYSNITLIYTGNIPQNRPLWLKIHGQKVLH